LREDPDVILVVNLRDLENYSSGDLAAETGTLYLARCTLTYSTKRFDRIIDVLPAEEKSMVRQGLSESLPCCGFHNPYEKSRRWARFLQWNL